MKRVPFFVKRVLIATPACFVFAGAGCHGLDRLLEVEDESRVTADDLRQSDDAALLVQGAVNDFNCAFGHYIAVGALIGDEMEAATNLLSFAEYDRRTVEPSDRVYSTATCDEADAAGFYMPLSTARWQADNVLELLRTTSDQELPQRKELLAIAAAYSGYSHLLIGEGMCSAAFDAGPELSRPETFERAADRFTTAIDNAQAAGSMEILNLARVGSARTLLNLGQEQEAAEVAEQVPVGFRLDAPFAATPLRNANSVYFFNNVSSLMSVGEIYRSASFDGVADPRVPVIDSGKTGTDQRTRIFVQQKFSNESAPIPIATWEEAQLILAEARQGQDAVEAINRLHEQVGLPPFTASDPASIRAQVTYERRMELFLESHHLGDFNRLNLPLTPAPGVPYPRGGGGDYGDQRCLPLPDVERLNNPNVD